MSDQWTQADSDIARGQGWDLWTVDPGTKGEHRAIQRLDEAERFDSDEQAIIYVEGRANAGDLRAQKALRLGGYTQ